VRFAKTPFAIAVVHPRDALRAHCVVVCVPQGFAYPATPFVCISLTPLPPRRAPCPASAPTFCNMTAVPFRFLHSQDQFPKLLPPPPPPPPPPFKILSSPERIELPPMFSSSPPAPQILKRAWSKRRWRRRRRRRQLGAACRVTTNHHPTPPAATCDQQHRSHTSYSLLPLPPPPHTPSPPQMRSRVTPPLRPSRRSPASSRIPLEVAAAAAAAAAVAAAVMALEVAGVAPRLDERDFHLRRRVTCDV
jgi:hypothetical protein